MRKPVFEVLKEWKVLSPEQGINEITLVLQTEGWECFRQQAEVF